MTRVHLVDGTYELFRAHFGAPSARGREGAEVGATRGLLRTLLGLLREDGVTHVACAFDTVIESFRNRLVAGYKIGDGGPEELMAQFPLAERADDAVAPVVICSPDTALAQCVRGSRIVCLDRRRRPVLDEAGTLEKFGVPPASIPDWLALVGDDADGIPGVPRWGAESAAAVLARYGWIEA